MRHPRALARIPPTQLGLWSFAVAIAHGAGLMLLPIYLGLCTVDAGDTGHQAASTLISGGAGEALAVASVLRLAMVIGGGLCAGARLSLVRPQGPVQGLAQSRNRLGRQSDGRGGALAAAEAALQYQRTENVTPPRPYEARPARTGILVSSSKISVFTILARHAGFVTAAMGGGRDAAAQSNSVVI